MANGFFLGGMAQGMNDAAELGIKRDTLSADTALRGRGLDIQQIQADLADKRLGQDLSLRTRALDLTEQAQKNAQSREMLSIADKQVTDYMSVISDTISQSLAAGKDPATVAQTARPLVEAAKSIAAKAGLDPGAIDVKVNTWMAQPTPSEKAVSKATSGVSAAKAVSEATGVTQREALQGQGVLKAEPRNSSVMEGIRAKIAYGEPLTGGEQKVYDDALKADPLARFLALSQGANAGAAPAQPAAAPTPAPQAAPQAKDTQALPEAFKNDPDGTVYMKGNARWMKQGNKLVKQ